MPQRKLAPHFGQWLVWVEREVSFMDENVAARGGQSKRGEHAAPRRR